MKIRRKRGGDFLTRRKAERLLREAMERGLPLLEAAPPGSALFTPAPTTAPAVFALVGTRQIDVALPPHLTPRLHALAAREGISVEALGIAALHADGRA